MKFERIVKFSIPFDKRTDDPSTNCGIGSMRIWFVLKGKHGAVQVMMGTQFFLPKTINEYLNSNNSYHKNLLRDIDGKDSVAFECWDVGFHSKKRPNYMKTSDKIDCDIFKNGCYYDGSSLRGKNDNVGNIFLEKGEEGIWEYLEKYYKEIFVNDATSETEKKK